jgi:uncharacterized protein (TIGR03083 family)
MSLPYNATQHILRDGQQLIDAVQRTGLDAPVVSCPGWNMRDLVWHIGEVWDFWTLVARKRITTVEQLKAESNLAQPDDDLLIDWVAAAHTGIQSILSTTPPDTEIWTWTGANRDLWWLRRRMAQETAVHRWDAERTVGDAYQIPIAVAADGIDEYLEWFAPKNRGASIGGTAHIHCGEWMIHRLDENGIEFEHAHAKGDVAIRGRARDILLWLWGREGGPVEFIGDRSIAQRIVSGADLG